METSNLQRRACPKAQLLLLGTSAPVLLSPLLFPPELALPSCRTVASVSVKLQMVPEIQSCQCTVESTGKSHEQKRCTAFTDCFSCDSLQDWAANQANSRKGE